MRCGPGSSRRAIPGSFSPTVTASSTSTRWRCCCRTWTRTTSSRATANDARIPVHRIVYAKGWGLLGRLLFGVTVKDTNCAFRFYRKEFLDALTIRSEGAMINLEVYARARRLGARIKEVEVSHLPRTSGQPTGGQVGVIVKAFRELAALYRALRQD